MTLSFRDTAGRDRIQRETGLGEQLKTARNLYTVYFLYTYHYSETFADQKGLPLPNFCRYQLNIHNNSLLLHIVHGSRKSISRLAAFTRPSFQFGSVYFIYTLWGPPLSHETKKSIKSGEIQFIKLLAHIVLKPLATLQRFLNGTQVF